MVTDIFDNIEIGENKIEKIITNLLICFISIICLVRFSFAAYNPFVTLKIENIDTTNYIVDLLVDNSKNEYKKVNNEDKEEEENYIFQNIQKEYNEWVLANYYGKYVDEIEIDLDDPFVNSKHVKTFRGIYFGQYVGNNDFYHEFYSNDGASGPLRTSVYKIILINKDTGEVKISKDIQNNKNNSFIIDAKTMKITSKIDKIQVVKTSISVLSIIILLVIIICKLLLKRKQKRRKD